MSIYFYASINNEIIDPDLEFTPELVAEKMGLPDFHINPDDLVPVRYNKVIDLTHIVVETEDGNVGSISSSPKGANSIDFDTLAKSCQMILNGVPVGQSGKETLIKMKKMSETMSRISTLYPSVLLNIIWS